MLNPCVEEAVEEEKKFSAETRARLERIRDTHPEFAELAEPETAAVE
jgi:DNA-binding TFAR19-related protein (PDSD5 family)